MALEAKSTGEKTILIVEDDLATGELLRLLLAEETPHRAIVVSDGFQALNIVKDITPHLFLLDDRLPQMSGRELYQRLHSISGLEHIPAIMTSTNAFEEVVETPHLVICLKPFNLDELLHAIEKLLNASK